MKAWAERLGWGDHLIKGVARQVVLHFRAFFSSFRVTLLCFTLLCCISFEDGGFVLVIPNCFVTAWSERLMDCR